MRLPEKTLAKISKHIANRPSATPPKTPFGKVAMSRSSTAQQYRCQTLPSKKTKEKPKPTLS